MSLSRWAVSLLVALFFGATATSAWAQTSSAIVGTVKDTLGGVMAGVTVTVVHEATQDKYQAVTNEAGDYRINLRQVGRFKVRAEMQGFKATAFSNILIEVGRTARVDASLEVGELSETLMVEAANPLVRSETSAIGEVIDNRKILELPLKGREYIQLATLMPGVASRNKRSAAHAVTQGFAIQGNGQRTAANNYRLNGVNNMGANLNTQAAAPPLDAVEEFQVVRNLYPVEFGRGAGVVVDVRGKSGGNELHGSLYEFNRNASMDARQYFARSKPGFTFNQYGGSLGGPVWLPKLYNGKNKTFFFFAYEGLKDRRATVSKIGVPTAANRNGDFSQSPYNNGVTRNPSTGLPYPGGIIPQSDWSPLGRRIMNLLPQPNNPESPLNYIGFQREPRDTARKIFRFDQKLGLHSAFAALNFLPAAKVIRHQLVSPLSDGRQAANYRQFSFGYTHVITPQFLSETRAGYLSSKNLNGPNGDFTNYPKQWGYPWVPPDGPLSGPPRHDVNLGFGQFSLMGGFGQEDFGDNAYNLVQTFSVNHGKHTLKGGLDLIHERFHILTAPFSRGVYIQNGLYTGNPWADLLLGLNQRSLFSVGAANIRIRRTQQAYFFQDDWKVHPNLTLNLGVRYDLIPGWAGPYVTSFDFKTGQVIYAAGAVSAEQRARIRFPARFDGPDTAYNAQGDWAPRFGLAWRPFGDNPDYAPNGLIATEPERRD